MESERSSSVRGRLAGKTCALCRPSLPPPHQPGEQLCTRCAAEKKPPHRVYMHFQTQSGWHCQFLEQDLKTPLSKKLNLVRQERLFDIAEHGGYALNLEGRQAMQRAIDMGRGGIWLELTEEQYRRLKGER
jgi:hypothetical protein